MGFKEIKTILDMFFQDNEIDEMRLKFSLPLQLYENEYKELIGAGELVNGSDNDWTIIDEYLYYEEGNTIVKLIIEYFIDYDIINVLEINLIREKKPDINK